MAARSWRKGLGVKDAGGHAGPLRLRRLTDRKAAVNEDNVKGIASAAALLGLTIWVGTWWLWLPALVVFGLCVVAAIPDGRGPAVPPSELREIEERLRAMERAVLGLIA